MNRELTKAMAPMIGMAKQQLALNTRAVKALESLAADIRWQRRRSERDEARQAKRDARYERERAYWTKQSKRKKGGAR